MADEYIKRDTAYNYLTEYYNHRTDNQHQNLRKALNAIPSADVQPVVHGEWVDGGVDGVGACGIEYRYNKCSVCGYEYSFPIKYNFCPNCGAYMRPDGGT